MSISKRIVTPGDVIGVEEEFMPIDGIYIDENSYLRSQYVGVLQIDVYKKYASVKKISVKGVMPKQGDVIEGVVTSMSDDLAFIGIYMVNDQPYRIPVYTGILHISQASMEFINSLYDAVRLGEVVRAKIINNNYPFQLTIKDPKLGVIVSYCSVCGSILYKKDDKLVCPKCGSVEKRKVSSFYIYR